MNKIVKRFREPSTYAGLGAVILGAGQLFNLEQASQISTLVIQAGTRITSGDYVTAGVTVALGLAAIFVKEKK